MAFYRQTFAQPITNENHHPAPSPPALPSALSNGRWKDMGTAALIVGAGIVATSLFPERSSEIMIHTNEARRKLFRSR